MKKLLKNDFIKIISGKNLNKTGKIISIKKKLARIFKINTLSKFFKIKFFNKIKYIFNIKTIPINISNISYCNERIVCKITFKKIFNKNYRFFKKNGIFNKII